MVWASASGRVVVEACGRYMFVSLFSLAFVMGEMSRPSRACSSTESCEVGWLVITNAPVGTVSKSELIGWV